MTSQNNVITAILNQRQIRPTRIRQEILRLFFEVNFALSNADIADKQNKKFDRVTVYRTLETFVQKGLVHKIVDGYGNVKYASHGYEGCDVNCSHHRHNHLHFTCNNCGNIYCICSIEVPMVNLPEGYSLQTLKLSAEGICDLCTKPKIAENC